jgi:hypothetical protein
MLAVLCEVHDATSGAPSLSQLSRNQRRQFRWNVADRPAREMNYGVFHALGRQVLAQGDFP